MWRFVVICLAFLAVAFYVLSGGASYAPAPNSLQAQAKLPLEERISYRAPSEAEAPRQTTTLQEVASSFENLDAAEDETEELALTFAAVRSDATGILEAEASRPKAELLNMALPETTFQIRSTQEDTQDDTAIDAAVAAALGEVTFDDSQIRWVKENIIDLRSGPGLTFDRVMQVTKGAEVAVLEDPGHGWLNVQVVNGFETGWVAEWLLTEPQ
ncbi:MAG: SH3 domain-containing protein [Pseudomonadota bacterium]